MNAGDKGVTKGGFHFVCTKVFNDNRPNRHALLSVRLPTHSTPDHVNIVVDNHGRYMHGAYETDYDVLHVGG